MLLSVIVPVHNVSKTLRPCLTSILQQGVRDCEVILVDDGSTDGSSNLCDLLSAENDRIKTFHKPNGGLSAARNLGLDKAQGQFITFVDSDDLLCHDTYRPILTYLEAHPHVDIAEFPVIVHYGNPKKEYHLTFHGEVYETLADYWLQGRGYAHSYAWNKLYRASLFYQVRYPVGRSFEDILTLPHLLLQSRSIATLSTGCYLYRWNDRGITASATGQQLKDLLDGYLSILPEACDARFYAQIVNVALDIYEATRHVPDIPDKPYMATPKLFIKHLFGLKRLCQLNQFIHKVYRRS